MRRFVRGAARWAKSLAWRGVRSQEGWIWLLFAVGVAIVAGQWVGSPAVAVAGLTAVAVTACLAGGHLALALERAEETLRELQRTGERTGEGGGDG